MDQTKTASYLVGPPENEALASVVLLHGFTGSPWDMWPLADALAARGMRVSVPRLPGHGTTPEAMLWCTYEDWERTAQEALLSCPRNRPVFVGGLSMGALLALMMAARFSDRVHGLALIAPAWKLLGAQVRLLRRLRRFGIAESEDVWLNKKSSDAADPRIHGEVPLMTRYPLARVYDLFRVQDRAVKALPNVSAPSLVIGAENDHVVSLDAVRSLQHQLPQSTLLVLPGGYHAVLRDYDHQRAIQAVVDFFDFQLQQNPKEKRNGRKKIRARG